MRICLAHTVRNISNYRGRIDWVQKGARGWEGLPKTFTDRVLLFWRESWSFPDLEFHVTLTVYEYEPPRLISL